MEFMSVSSSPYDTDRFGAALPRFSPRQSDLLMVVGTVTHKQAPILLKVYEQMCEPKWVMAFGVCATSGGFYQNYAALAGIDRIIPVDVYVPGCPPRPETVIDGIMQLQDKIARQKHSDHHEGLLMAQQIFDSIRSQLGSLAADEHCLARHAGPPDRAGCAFRAGADAKGTFRFDMLLDVTAIDWPARQPRFDVVWHFYSTTHKRACSRQDAGRRKRSDGRLADAALWFCRVHRA